MDIDLLTRIPRGGSTIVDSESEEEEEEVEADVEEEDDDNDEEEEDKSKSAAASGEPVSITVKTNTGNPLIDVSLELMMARSKKIENVKATVSRMLKSRPPVESFSIRYHGMLLDDESFVHELIDEEDEDDDDEESSGKVLTLDMIPPVDPKFATQLSKMQEMSTSELLDAYATNSAAMYQNGYELYSNALNTQNQADDEDEESSQSSFSVQAPVSSRLQEQAQAIREKLVAKFPEKALELLNEEGPPSDPSEMLQKRRGQRYRTSRGGVRTNLKRTIQTNLNINWSDTIRNFVLFLFFGIFGGRNSVSRNLLILGAPLCFVLQARPMKLALKQLFYFCSRPPGILLSLLSAPQQAILNFLQDVELQAVYGIERKADLDDEMMKGGEFDEEESSILESLANVDDEEETDDTTDDEYDDEEETDISEEVEESDDETDED
eukprot:CAMPEP_0194199800 /NCGR_PEP_ID=MMETSP0156-20130528/677_1 /TAXON_ID=33649 /ORGANISM="Thalassionema nitzschioides, Strain L26-B" /LENGTH=437 /DNA_ID=CAMNT_0038924739 /DNA_START=251 /DNA_END=1564 /DNA_ORIENTATION=+